MWEDHVPFSCSAGSLSLYSLDVHIFDAKVVIDSAVFVSLCESTHRVVAGMSLVIELTE
jgi:hypothetical protein